MKIFIIGSARNATDEVRQLMEEYVSELEREGHIVHLPHRDTNQQARGLDICKQNRDAIANADEVHILYDKDSQGSHFDLGVAFAMNKRIRFVLVPEEVHNEGKSFPKMIAEWIDEERISTNFQIMERVFKRLGT